MGDRSLLHFKETLLAEAGLVNLPRDWSIVQINELLSEDRGISVGVMYPGEHDPFGIPLIKVGDLTHNFINPNPEFRITPQKHYEYRRTALEGGEILLTLVGDVGKCAIVPPKMATWNAARAVAVIRLKNPKDVNYVRLCLLSRPLQHLMQIWANTTVQVTLNLKEIKELPLPWPPLKERIGISKVLDTLDEKIGLHRQMNETLEAMIKAIFKSWFVDFDPVYAKMEGQTPYGVNSEIASLFPNSFDVSPLGEIPMGWRIGMIGDVADNPRRGVTPNNINQNTPYIGLEHMPRKSIALEEWGVAKEVSSNKFRFYEGEILFGKLRPYFHKVGVAVQDGVCSTDVSATLKGSQDAPHCE